MRSKTLYVFRQDKIFFLKTICRHPFLYFFRWIHSFFMQPKVLQEDIYLCNCKNLAPFQKDLSKKNSLLFLGFSYCQKPLFCPSQRFSTLCPIKNSSLCQKCPLFPFISLIEKDRYLMITTALELGKKILDLQKKHPKKKLYFLIACCDFSRKMFTPYATILGVKGMVFSLKGPVCTNFSAFYHAEMGKKKNQTFLNDTQQMLLMKLLKHSSKTI